jgi:hypothetical protein
MRGLLEKDLMGDTSGHEAGALTVVRSSLKATFASGFTWAAGALAAAFMTCCGLGAWVVMPMALVAIFTIALAVNAARQAVLAGPGALVDLPDPDLFSDGAVQVLARRMTAARTRLERVLRESRRGQGQAHGIDLARVQQSAAEMERRVLVLAARAEYVASFLSSLSVTEIKGALDFARAREGTAPSPDAGRLYRRLIETYEGHLKSVHALELEKERLLVTGEQLVGALEAFPATVTCLQCWRLAVGDDAATEDAIQSAAGACQDLDALEAALQEERAVAG